MHSLTRKEEDKSIDGTRKNTRQATTSITNDVTPHKDLLNDPLLAAWKSFVNRSFKDLQRARRSRRCEHLRQTSSKLKRVAKTLRPELKKRNSNALKFSEREDGADWAENLAGQSRVKTLETTQ